MRNCTKKMRASISVTAILHNRRVEGNRLPPKSGRMGLQKGAFFVYSRTFYFYASLSPKISKMPARFLTLLRTIVYVVKKVNRNGREMEHRKVTAQRFAWVADYRGLVLKTVRLTLNIWVKAYLCEFALVQKYCSNFPTRGGYVASAVSIVRCPRWDKRLCRRSQAVYSGGIRDSAFLVYQYPNRDEVPGYLNWKWISNHVPWDRRLLMGRLWGWLAWVHLEKMVLDSVNRRGIHPVSGRVRVTYKAMPKWWL